MEGGLFREYALRNFDSMKTYIEEAIVRNLSGYLKKEMDMETARTLTYSVLYKAVCPSNLSRVPTLNSSHATLHNFLDRMGVNTELEIKDFELDRVSEIFEQIGLITRVPNYDTASSLREQYYISNPSLTCQLILVVYGLRDIDSSVLGHVYESCVMTQLAANKLEEHDIYFLNSENHDDGENNMELDAVVTDRDCEFVYLFECKFAKTDKIHPGATLLSGRLEKNYFQESEIVGRYVVYNGRPCVKEYDIGTVVFTPMGDMLDRYFEFSDNVHELVEIEDE
jgi:hypothetical protein